MKQPPWTWEIPLYFFVGGAAGAAAVVGAIADYTGADRKLVREARWIAAAGSVLSPALLISDLGRPMRFLNMMRVFKPQSPMSVGVWTLLGFSGGASAAAFAGFMRDRFGPSFQFEFWRIFFYAFGSVSAQRPGRARYSRLPNPVLTKSLPTAALKPSAKTKADGLNNWKT